MEGGGWRVVESGGGEGGRAHSYLAQRARPLRRAVPDRLELHAHDGVEALEERVLDGELRDVDALVDAAELCVCVWQRRQVQVGRWVTHA